MITKIRDYIRAELNMIRNHTPRDRAQFFVGITFILAFIVLIIVSTIKFNTVAYIALLIAGYTAFGVYRSCTRHAAIIEAALAVDAFVMIAMILVFQWAGLLP